MDIWADIEEKVKEAVKLSFQTVIWEEFDIKYMLRNTREDRKNLTKWLYYL